MNDAAPRTVSVDSGRHVGPVRFLRALYCESCGQGLHGSKGAALAPEQVARFRKAHQGHPKLAYRGPIGGDLPMLTDTWDVEQEPAHGSAWARFKAWLFGLKE